MDKITEELETETVFLTLAVFSPDYVTHETYKEALAFILKNKGEFIIQKKFITKEKK